MAELIRDLPPVAAGSYKFGKVLINLREGTISQSTHEAVQIVPEKLLERVFPLLTPYGQKLLRGLSEFAGKTVPYAQCIGFVWGNRAPDVCTMRNLRSVVRRTREVLKSSGTSLTLETRNSFGLRLYSEEEPKNEPFIFLTRKEANILAFLLERPGTYRPYEDIVIFVAGSRGREMDVRMRVRSQIKRIRQKLRLVGAAEYLRTGPRCRLGCGYGLFAPDAQ